ncbi:hypothetical protein WJX72_007237 [[Myrmecia] bisecta]|uniref:Calcineurin-like phosphoesterase domain-containing protein n=1 Tax=[Myrmecia] bisecta TaxID=41462 RepID=A0AAW1PAK3_9CHLO
MKPICALLVLALAGAYAQTPNFAASYPPVGGLPLTSPLLKFDDTGKFHIMQIADVHYANGTNSKTENGTVLYSKCQNILPAWEKYPCSDVNSTDLMTSVLAREKPNLVVYSGDNVWYDTNVDVLAAHRAVTQPVRDSKTPYMITFGNHDCERKPCRRDLMTEDRKSNYSLSQYGPEGVKGVGNYAYTIAGQDGRPAWAVYVFDGGAYYEFGNNSLPSAGNYSGYDFVNAAQVDWYNKTSMALEKSQGRKIPAIAFTHIPLPEYDIAFTCANKAGKPNPSFIDFSSSVPSGCNAENFTPACASATAYPNTATLSGAGLRTKEGCEQVDLVGNHYEGVYSANVNGGLFAAFMSRGDVKMVNVGHDHINDYCANLMGIRLCYGGGFGYYAYGLEGWPRRSRQIVLNEDGSITTWKRLDSYGNFAKVDIESFNIAQNVVVSASNVTNDAGNVTSSTIFGGRVLAGAASN